jgi:hypothetical protein
LGEINSFDSGKEGALLDLELSPGGQPLAEHLIQQFESLPWTYTVTFILPENLKSILPPSLPSYNFGPNVRLVSLTDEMITTYSEGDGLKAQDRGGLFGLLEPQPKVEVGSVALQMEVTGFVGGYSPTPPLQTAETQLKAFLGLLLSQGVLTTTPKFISYTSGYNYHAHRREGKKLTPVGAFKLDSDASALIAKLVPHDVAKSENSGVLIALLQRMVPVFEHQSAISLKLQLAASWLFSSQANQKDLLAFVQAMVCLEILLGEKKDDPVSIVSIIRNRCAYLVARSHEERDAIMKNVSEIYQVRSKIVHQGHPWLSQTEVNMLYRLRSYCDSVINSELALGMARG